MIILNVALTPLTWPCGASIKSFQWFSPEILDMYWTSLYLAVPPDSAWADMAPMFPRPLKWLLSLNVSLAHMHLGHFWRNPPPCPHYYLIKSCHIHSAECTAETRHTSTSVAAIAYTVVGTRQLAYTMTNWTEVSTLIPKHVNCKRGDTWTTLIKDRTLNNSIYTLFMQLHSP